MSHYTHFNLSAPSQLTCQQVSISLFPMPYALYPVHPIPHSLFPKPYSLFPIHYTSCPISNTLYPMPYAPYPVHPIPYIPCTPYSLYPIPCSLFPITHTPYPVRQTTRYRIPDTVNPKPDALSTKPSPSNRRKLYISNTRPQTPN